MEGKTPIIPRFSVQRIDLNKNPRDCYPYHYEDTDGALITIWRKTQKGLEELRLIYEQVLGKPKAFIHFDRTENHDPDLSGYAFRDIMKITTIIVERDSYIALITYSEKSFSASRFAKAVERVEIPLVEALVADEEEWLC